MRASQNKSKLNEGIENVAKNEMVECEVHSQDLNEDVDLIDFSEPDEEIQEDIDIEDVNELPEQGESIAAKFATNPTVACPLKYLN
jgi:hypothetical protein